MSVAASGRTVASTQSWLVPDTSSFSTNDMRVLEAIKASLSKGKAVLVTRLEPADATRLREIVRAAAYQRSLDIAQTWLGGPVRRSCGKPTKSYASVLLEVL